VFRPSPAPSSNSLKALPPPEIMEMDEYYLTRAEHEIFEREKSQILQYISGGGNAFRLLELGAGDGLKTRVLLQHFSDASTDFNYCPVDISPNVLSILEEEVSKQLPELSVQCISGDYFEALGKLDHEEGTRNVVLFLGSTIGNFNQNQAIEFLSKLRSYLDKDDMMLIGFDLRKKPDTILKAYNDPGGITRRFNLNLLDRINKELGGNIDVDAFDHYPIYNPSTGECKSYLINRSSQKFYLEALDKEYALEDWEPIFTEVSKKYSKREIEELAEKSGFEIINHFYDSNHYFCDSLWIAV
ncbi:MAG: L-histidine N(alpha)-methyltransferase, partial [Bacteroidota bacterium]